MKIGALFAGYGGLDLAVSEVLGGHMAWYSEIDKGALKILGHRFPDVPNVGDVTTVDWSSVEPVDVITGGSPCQDLSHAGRRAGMTDGTRSNLWVAMREAIAQLRPGLVVWENVRGALSAPATSAVEPCAGCVGDRPGVSLRAFGRVVGDLSELGYVGRWHGLRAADVGAPHGRWRVFLVATDARGIGGHQAVEHGGRGTSAGGRAGLPDQSDRDALRTGPIGELLPTPAAHDSGNSVENHLRKKPGRTKVTSLEVMARGGLLPTPRASDGAKGGPNQRGSSGDLMLPSAVALLPTPSVADVMGGRKARSGDRNDEPLLNGIAAENLWGDYAAAIARWEHVLGRAAPAPTMTSSKGNPQLAPAFVEWLMGLPAGWVTDVPGITRNEALKALGNGVVWQQAAAALRLMLGQERAA